MRLRRFSARSSQEATALVKAALGPEALILEIEEHDGVVTVSAATDGDERPATRREDALAAEVRELTGLVRHLVSGARPGEALPDLTRLHGAAAPVSGQPPDLLRRQPGKDVLQRRGEPERRDGGAGHGTGLGKEANRKDKRARPRKRPWIQGFSGTTMASSDATTIEVPRGLLP